MFSKGEKWYDKLFNEKYLPLFHPFKAIYQFPKHIIFLVKIVAFYLFLVFAKKRQQHIFRQPCKWCSLNDFHETKRLNLFEKKTTFVYRSIMTFSGKMAKKGLYTCMLLELKWKVNLNILDVIIFFGDYWRKQSYFL